MTAQQILITGDEINGINQHRNTGLKLFFLNMSVKKLQYELTSYTTLQDYHTIQLYNTTETMPRGVKDYDYPETN